MTEPGVLSAWRTENATIFTQTIAAAAEQLGIPQLAVEKDYWVCEALRAVERHAPGHTIFKGGTSLEKMRLIDRGSPTTSTCSSSSTKATRDGPRRRCGTCARRLRPPSPTARSR
jgi:hypothetical protein